MGEWLKPGEVGRLATATATATAALAVVFYAWATASKQEEEARRWTRAAHGLFLAHAGSLVLLIGTLFFLIVNHRFEYDYVWKHSSLDLPMRFILSSFWEGQEGSFLLWAFWHAVLGTLVLRFAPRDWKAPVLAVVSGVQLFLGSMVLGVYAGGIKIGSSPFVLIRQLPENIGLPWTQMPDYLERIPAFMDGNGLNPLLQNYWMTIHPPILFLGFASTLIPFAYALAGLWTGRYTEWMKPALPWAFFSVGILGTGILMGGAWAYEALSFGGFWAWDPVENSSLVPWLTMVGAAHLMLIYRNKGGTLHWALILSILSFLLVLYSTFLTRSGILGDTSVHAFVDLGLSGQLLVYLLTFTVLAFGLYAFRFRHLPKSPTEDPIGSREFWMFIGALTLLVSAFQISLTTSIPVINALVGPEGWIPLLKTALAPPIDVAKHYNGFQIPFAILIAAFMGFGQYLRYGSNPRKGTFRTLLRPLIAALVLGIGISAVFSFHRDFLYLLLLLASGFAIAGNIDYALSVLKGRVRKAGASLAHVGFGLLLLGALISTGRQRIISANDSFIAKDFPQNENLLLELGDTVDMPPYRVRWTGERIEGNYRYYDVEYASMEDPSERFVLSPTILMNDRMGNSPEPDTRHQLGSDLYTHVTYAPLEPELVDKDGFGKEASAEMHKGDTAILDQSFVILDSLHSDFGYGPDGAIAKVEVEAVLRVIHLNGADYVARPVFVLEGQDVQHRDAVLDPPGLKFRLDEIKPQDDVLVIKSWRKVGDEKPFIVLKAIVFPMINLLWLGSILMAIGTAVAVIERLRLRKAAA